MCRCTQHHQQEKSAPQRHRPLSSAADHATERRKAQLIGTALQEAPAEQTAGWNKYGSSPPHPRSTVYSSLSSWLARRIAPMLSLHLYRSAACYGFSTLANQSPAFESWVGGWGVVLVIPLSQYFTLVSTIDKVCGPQSLMVDSSHDSLHDFFVFLRLSN